MIRVIFILFYDIDIDLVLILINIILIILLHYFMILIDLVGPKKDRSIGSVQRNPDGSIWFVPKSK